MPERAVTPAKAFTGLVQTSIGKETNEDGYESMPEHIKRGKYWRAM